MREAERIARLFEQTFEGRPYYGPSVLAALENVAADTAMRKPDGAVHTIWELVAHLTAELRHARELLKGTAVPWVEGQTTWPVLEETSALTWEQMIEALTEANRAMVQEVEQLDDSLLEKPLAQVRRTYYVMLHGTIQHDSTQRLSCGPDFVPETSIVVNDFSIIMTGR